MATQTKKMNIDLAAEFEQVAAQFRGLDPKQPGQWPILPKVASWAALGALVVILGYVLLLSDAVGELDAERNKEPGLKQDYHVKLAQAVNLPELRKQKLQVEEYVTQLEKQLPGKAEMDALLTDINQAGIGRGLQFELFRPGVVAVKDYYAELPITIRISGRYHDIGAFAADVANLSRIVTLHDMSIAGAKGEGGVLAMDAVARTYRYLDPSEVASQKKPGDVAPKKKAKGK